MKELALLLLVSLAAQGVGGAVVDEGGNAVEGAYVFAFRAENPDTRRPPDFVSRPSDGEGRYVLYLPDGNYIIKARKKISGERFGPLETHDLTSAGKNVVKVKTGQIIDMDLTVSDLKTAASFSYDERTDMAIIRGRIKTGEGKPLREAYAVAFRDKRSFGLPDHISALTGDDGKFDLFVPAGSEVLVGAAVGPIDSPKIMGELRNVKVENSIISGIDIVIDEDR